MTVSGINNLPNPWFWQQAQQAAASSTGVAATTGTARGGQTTQGAGAAASNAAVSQFSAMIQALVTQLQSDTGGAGSTAAPAATGATAGQTSANATAAGATASDTTASAAAGQTATAANTTSDGQNGQVTGQYHGHHHHHHGGGADKTQSLSATDQTALQSDANNLVDALFGPPSNANAVGTTATAGTPVTGASTAAASPTITQPAGTPPQTIAGVFAQDMLNAIQAYTAQNPANVAGITPALNAVA